MSSTERATTWSITINNPTEADTKCEVPGWKLSGQFEQGEEGTPHFQGMLRTPQVRFAAVKKVFPRAHIEVARNVQALATYVNKKETRVAVYEAQGVPSMFEYQSIVAARWDQEEFQFKIDEHYHHGPRKCKTREELALEYVDEIVADLIEEGYKAIEFIAINPMWRSSWRKFYASIIKRHAPPVHSSNVQAPAEAG